MDLMSEDLSRRETPVLTLTLISPLDLRQATPSLSQHPLPPLQKKAQMALPTKAQGEDEIRQVECVEVLCSEGGISKNLH